MTKKRIVSSSNDALDQTIHPVVHYDDALPGIRHSPHSRSLPPTANGYGHEALEAAVGTSPGGYRPTEELAFNELAEEGY